jgi:Acetyltransferase (GNAT) domain
MSSRAPGGAMMSDPGPIAEPLGPAGRSIPVRVIGAGDPAWDEWLRDVPRDIYHTAGYHAFSGECGEGDPTLIVVGDRRRGIAWPYLLRRVDDVPELVGADARDVNSVYGYPGPLAWGCLPGDRFVARAWSEVVQVWRSQRVVAVFTRFHPLLENASLLSGLAWPADEAAGLVPVTAVGPTVSIDCTIGDDAARVGYARALRQHIAAGRREGLTTIHDEQWTDLPTFVHLYRETMVRNGAADYYFFDLGYFDRLRAALLGHLHLLVTRLGSTVGAAGLFTEYEGIVQAHLVGTNAKLRALSPFKVLLDDARTWARERGNRVLHLGGGRGGRDDTLMSFKGEFSPRRHLFHTGRWILDEGLYRDLVNARLAVGGDSRQVDPTFFPAYRAPLVETSWTEPLASLQGK